VGWECEARNAHKEHGGHEYLFHRSGKAEKIQFVKMRETNDIVRAGERSSPEKRF
jgi:hypothetical protein